MKRIYFITQGCSANFAETEIMQGLCKKAGYKLVNNISDSDIIIINICTVKNDTTALKQIKEIVRHNKKMIVAGCITKKIIFEIRKINPKASLINTHNIHNIVYVINETLNSDTVTLINKNIKSKTCLPRIRRNPVIGIIPILNSCNSFCTYCSTRIVKGKLFSYPIKTIITDIKTALNEGCKEIWITSQDNSSYMLDKKNKSQLANLIDKILNIKKKFYLRIGMMNPADLLPILDGLIDCYNNSRIFKFAHIPVQSGNDEILKKMKRRYCLDDFLFIVKEMKNKIKKLTLSTDVIVGFPSETNEQFYDSIELIKKIKPDVLNISRYQPREGTLASKMKQLSGSVIKDRSRIMTNVFNNLAKKQNEKWINWRGKVLIDECGKNNTMIGRNFAYKPVIVKGGELGSIVQVRINKITGYDLRT